MSEILETRGDGIILRFATTDDKESLYAFALDAIAGADLPAFAEDAGDNLQERIEKGDPKNVIIALDSKESNKIVGYIELDSQKRDYKDIKGVFVLPDYRRRGIGKSMLRMIQKYNMDQGVQLRINAFTKEGLKFWQSYGFKIHHYSLYFDNSS